MSLNQLKSSLTQQSYQLIARNLHEIINPEHLLKLLNKQQQPKGYWGTEPVGSIHIDYLLPLIKLKDIVQAGCHVTILIADIHALLENQTTSWKKIQLRTKYYILMLKAMLRLLQVDLNQVDFVIGSTYQLTPEVTMDLYRLANQTTINQAISAGIDVVKQEQNPKLTSLIYPLLQTLDEQYLQADFELGSIDQRSIFAFSQEKTIQHQCTYLLMPNVSPKKKTFTDDDLLIDVLDKPDLIIYKIRQLSCLVNDIKSNSVLSLFKNLVFHLTSHFYLIQGGDSENSKLFNSYQELEQSYQIGDISPVELQDNLADYLINLLEPIRQEFNEPDKIDLYMNAYWDL